MTEGITPERAKVATELGSRLAMLSALIAKGDFRAIKAMPLGDVLTTLLHGSVDVSDNLIQISRVGEPHTAEADSGPWDAWKEYVRLTKNHYKPQLDWAASVLELLLQCRFGHDEISAGLASRGELWAAGSVWNAAAKKIRPNERWTIFEERAPEEKKPRDMSH